MSGFDPLAALAADAALQTSSVAAIDLGVAIEILQAQLAVGDLLTATVLPPQGGSDRLALLGQTVLAQLPPGVDPGQSLLLQVTGFAGNQIVVRNLGVVDPNNPPPTANVTLPPPVPGAPQQATLTTVLQNPAAAKSAAAQAPPAQPAPAAVARPLSEVPVEPATPTSIPPPGLQPGYVAPPRAVFVAASVQPAVLPEPEMQPAEGQQGQPAVPIAPAAAGAELELPPAQAALAGILAEVEADVVALGLEARIAATRAASIDLADLVTTPAQPRGAQPSPGVPSAPVAPLPYAGPGAVEPPPAVLVPAHDPVSADPTAAPAAPAPPATAEEALLARLRVPVGPLTLAAARLASSAASLIPRTFARLEAALASVAAQDPRAGTLRNLLSFVSRLDPSNARALPEQLMSFTNNVVGGAEAKIAAIVRELLQAVPPEEREQDAAPLLENGKAQTPAPAKQTTASQAPPAAAASSAAVPRGLPQGIQPLPANVPAPATESSQPAQPPAPLPPAIAAHVAERMAALEFDLKSAIVSLAQTAPAARGGSPDLVPALNEALTAVTALQLNVLNAQSANPNTIAIPLPMFFHENGRPVQLHVSREAPRGGKLDADNFHIAFVLDTQSLGVVAVDLQTVGRAVSVNVKTEATPAADRFRSTLDDLRGRLQQLHYSVSSIAAGVAPHRFGPQPEAAPPAETGEPAKTGAVDARA